MKTRTIACSSLIVVLCATLAAQTTETRRSTVRTILEGRPATLHLLPHLTTTIRLPEPVNSVVVGDANLFQAEHSPDEPLLVFTKPVTPAPSESNLVISTTYGRQFIFTLKNVGSASGDSIPVVDLFVNCRPAAIFFVEETLPAALVPETLSLADTIVSDVETLSADAPPLDDVVSRQGLQRLRNLEGNDIRVSVGEVVERGSRLIVSFSVVNPGSTTIELVPPQVQLANQTKSGLFRRTRWNTVQQLPVERYQISDRRLRPGERIDGALIFERPSIKQSDETLFLQIADSAAIDRPTLAPISFRQTTATGEER
jgi:hypothetical protein